VVAGGEHRAALEAPWGADLARPQGEGKGHPTPAGNKRRAHRHALDGV